MRRPEGEPHGSGFEAARWFRGGRAWLRGHVSRRNVLGTIGVLMVLGVGSVLLLTAKEPAPDDIAAASSSASPVAASSAAPPLATASPTPAPTPSDWTALTLPPYEPVAELVPDTADGSGISVTGALTIRSLTSTPAVELAAGLVVQPPVELEVQHGARADEATIRPASPLVENERYNFMLYDADGSLVGEWTYRTGGPLHVVRQLPDDRSTQVPVDTGIELEFDQDDVVAVGDHFAIDPPVQGTFEVHGRTWVFVPTAKLRPSTLYTITLGAGVGIRDSDQILESDVRFAFETATGGSSPSQATVAFEGPLYEVRPEEAPVIPVSVWHRSHSEALPPTRTVNVYALGTLNAAIDAATTLSEDRSWATASTNGAVATDDLSAVGTFEARLVLQSREAIHLPSGLPAGWYLVEVAQEGRDAQIVLQVTDLAAYVLVSETRTVAWVNDITSDAPIANAEVTLPNGTRLGRTGTNGLLDVASPEWLLSDPAAGDEARMLVTAAADGRRVITPLPSGARTWPSYGYGRGSSDWWILFATDRLLYRTDDTIHAWGVVRSRADRSVPTDIELRLVAGWNVEGPPVARTRVTATPKGVVVGDITVDDLPVGEYTVGIFVDGTSVGRAGVSVTEIRKPAFRVDVETERGAYITGESVTASIGARFYDGSGAPGLRLRVHSSASTEDGPARVVTLGPSGPAQLTYTARTPEARMDVVSISASPAQPEEGTSTGSAAYAVFPSTVWLEGEAVLEGTTATISGELTRVDLVAAASQMASGWVRDPGAEPVSGRPVTIIVDRVTYRPIQEGTAYDFIEKKTVPVYRYEREVERLGTWTRTSAADGSFELSVPYSGTGGIEVLLRATDEQGRAIEADAWGQTNHPSAPSNFPYLDGQASTCGGWPAGMAARLDEEVTLTVRAGDGTPSAEGRTLFIVGHLGITDVGITDGAEHSTVFRDDDMPSLTVQAVRISPAGYLVMNEALVRVDLADTTVEVAVETDRARYAPRDDVGVAITTVTPDGQPIATDVVIQAIDAKLYAMGGAAEIRTEPLMAPVSSGFSASYATHRVPPPIPGDGCGAATGGEPREDFRDAATFQVISTGADGHGSATFAVPDDLTSWVVSATAVGGRLQSGTASIEVPVGLPFFVDATIAPEYLVGEAPILQLRTFGDELRAGDAVRFTIEAASLGLSKTAIDGRAFEPARAPLPALTAGEHRLTITAERVGSGPELRDAVRRTIRVVPTRLRTQETAYEMVDATLHPAGGEGLTTYSITDAGRGALLRVLNELAWSASARFDATLAAQLAREILVDDFGTSESELPPTSFAGIEGHPPEGLALLPYASADLWLTARTALVAPDKVSADFLRTALLAEIDDASSRERRIAALAGLAGLGDDVIADLRAAETEDLTLRERTWLALGYEASGDEGEAREIERSILTEYGQHLGGWVRLDLGASTPETAEATASVMLLAAELRDPIAVDIARYVTDNPSSEHLPALELAGFSRAAMEWLPRDPARFAWVVDGDRQVETLEHGEDFRLTLTPAQARSLTVERIEGTLAVTSTWMGNADAADLPSDPSVTIKRTVTPADHAPSDDLVRVTLDVTFAEQELTGCYQVTDLLPSGLAPVVARMDPWGTDQSIIGPYAVEGQRVSWCIDDEKGTARLGYSARVVSAGSYRWEPAVIQLATAPSIGSATPATTYTVD